ncbi:MAG: hypothetical protein E6230_04290 [Paenibacillus dendritiformis]|uniref:hypothetical protein n=1 Tax=Paenibacillus dendritiformis TaxID=130049 RepID=UPI001B205AB0|nr:hypothetical protein [Paenibacillus dendritiformis]MDU5141388.1 hypothetical protein [Paenibacillus dendritiformis]GIO72261.1 hypothetical protein J27TS7_17750 [Paenibacillus dendritiformis]
MSWKLIHRNGETYPGAFNLLRQEDLPQLKKSDGWSRGIDWSIFLRKNQEYTAYKLHIVGDNRIQGLLAIAIRTGFVELAIAEKAFHNRKPNEEFKNVGDVLLAHACLCDLVNNGDGYVLFKSKMSLMGHYGYDNGMEVVNKKRRLLCCMAKRARLFTWGGMLNAKIRINNYRSESVSEPTLCHSTSQWWNYGCSYSKRVAHECRQ